MHKQISDVRETKSNLTGAQSYFLLLAAQKEPIDVQVPVKLKEGVAIPQDAVQVASLFPTTGSACSFCKTPAM